MTGESFGTGRNFLTYMKSWMYLGKNILVGLQSWAGRPDTKTEPSTRCHCFPGTLYPKGHPLIFWLQSTPNYWMSVDIVFGVHRYFSRMGFINLITSLRAYDKELHCRISISKNWNLLTGGSANYPFTSPHILYQPFQRGFSYLTWALND